MIEADISLTSEGEFEFFDPIETENEQMIKISVKIVPKSDGEVIFEFSFEVFGL